MEANVGNACLEAFIKKKFYVKAGREFGPLEGHTLIINKALCGLHSSGPQCHERLSDCLRYMGYEPCKMELDFWLRVLWGAL